MKDLETIPFLSPEVKVDKTGKIFLNNEEITLSTFIDRYGIKIEDPFILTIIVHHKLKLPPRLWCKLTLIGNETPISIHNRQVTFRDPVESAEHPGFYYIPYFSNYVISREGILVRLSDGFYPAASTHNQGYYTFRMLSDTGKQSSYLRHRIIAMAFFFPMDLFIKLEVNHINSIRGDDRLDNLEWVYKSGNMRHAYDNKRRTDNKEIQARDTATGNIYIFTTCTRAAVFFNVSVWSVIHSANANGYKSVNGIQYRYHPDISPWPEPNVYGGYVLTNNDGSVEIVNIRELAKRLNTTLEKISRKLRRKHFKFDNFIVEPIAVPHGVNRVE